MATRIADTLLLLLTIAGVALTFAALRERGELQAEYESHVGRIGRLNIDDDSQIHIQKLETASSMQFAWRVYLPAASGARIQYRGYHGDAISCGQTSSGKASGREDVLRVTLRVTEEGPQAYGPGGLVRVVDPRVSTYLQEHWEEIEVVAAGADTSLSRPPGKAIRLLEVRLPNRLVVDFVEQHGAEYRSAVAKPFSFYLGLQSAKGWP